MSRFGVGRGAWGVGLAVLVIAGCRQDMHDAPRYKPLAASVVFPNGASAQPLVAGTVPRGFLREDVGVSTGVVDNVPVATFPFAITRADLDRGQERFDIYCSPCHGRTGEGNGMVVQRGFRTPPSYHIDRLRQMPPGYFVNVMTQGFGVMPDYATQVPIEDRWRIAAYIRALQLTMQATAADVPAEELRKLNNPAPPAAEGKERE
jgi:mono/diheme cytochrome c family protein